MPIVPQRSPVPVDSTPLRRPLPGVRVIPNAPEDAFGPPQLPNMSGVQQQIADIYQRETAKSNQIAVNDADNQAAALRDKVQWGTDEEPGILLKKGKDAVAGRDDALNQWQQGVSDITNGLSNDQQKSAFQARAASYGYALHEQVQAHVAAEHQRYDSETTGALVQNRVNDAVQNSGNPQVSEHNVESAKAAISDFASRNGKSPDYVQEQQQKVVSQIRYGVIEKMVTGGQDLDAQRYLALHNSELLPTQLEQAQRLTNASSVLGESQRQSDAIVNGSPAAVPGLLTRGNIDLKNRPRVANPDGSISTVRSMSFEEDGKEILIPTVSPGGKVLTDSEAIALYHRTGQHLGIFQNADAATAYAQQLHQAQADMLAGRGDGTVPGTGGAATSLSDAMAQAAKITDPHVRQETERLVRQSFEDKATSERLDRDQTFEKSWQTVQQNGGDYDAIPLADKLKLSPTQTEQLQKGADSIRHPVRRTDASTYTKLVNMASINAASRAEFAHLNLMDYQSKLSDSDYRYLVRLQGSTLRGDDRSQTAQEARLHRSEETGVIKSLDAYQKSQAGIANPQNALDSARAQLATKYGQRLTRPTVPQWMADSAKTDPEYMDHLMIHGYDPKVNPVRPSAAPQPKAPGAPIQ